MVIALPEIDPAFADKRFVLALLKDGKPLDANEVPYRLVIPDEKRMARWVRQVTALRILDAPEAHPPASIVGSLTLVPAARWRRIASRMVAAPTGLPPHEYNFSQPGRPAILPASRGWP
ncbi:MAG: hypothetical protein ABSD75_27590 [Terriglobales bacterium]